MASVRILNQYSGSETAKLLIPEPRWLPERGKVHNAQTKTKKWTSKRCSKPLAAWFLFRNILHICSCQVETNWLRKDRFLFDSIGNTLSKRQKLCKHFLHQESEQMKLYLWMIQHQQLFWALKSLGSFCICLEYDIKCNIFWYVKIHLIIMLLNEIMLFHSIIIYYLFLLSCILSVKLLIADYPWQ